MQSGYYFSTVNGNFVILKTIIFVIINEAKYKYPMKKHISVIFLLISWLNSFASLQIRSLTTRDGLSQSEVNNIMQDSYGYIWLSTTDGLNRTDGVSTKVMNLTPKNLQLTQIYGVIQEDNYKNLWISISGDALIHNLITEQTILLSETVSELPEFDKNNRLYIHKGTTNTIWITDEYKLLELEYTSSEIKIKRTIQTNGKRIRNIFIDKRGTEWVSLWDGLYRIKGKTIEKKSELRLTRIYSGDDAVFGISRDGIYMMSYLSNYGNWTKVSGIVATALTISQNKLWIGTERGLHQMHVNQLRSNADAEITKIDIGEQINVKSLFTDNNNQIWIGVDLGGARILNTNKTKFDHYKYASANGFNNRIRSIHEDDNGNLWIGTRGTGIAFIPNYQNDYSNPVFLPSEMVSTIGNSFCSAGDQVFSVFKTFSSIKVNYRGQKPEFSVRNIPLPKEEDILLVCTADPNGKYIWIGPYSKNLIRYDIEKDKTEIINLTYEKNIDPKSFVIRNIKFDFKGNMWIGTSNGLLIISSSNLENNNYTCKYYYNSDEYGNLSGNYVEPIFFDKRNNVWIGTFSGNINYSGLDETGLPVSFDNLNNKYYFTSGTIRSILEDDNGVLWISSNKGLFQYNPGKGQFITYDINDGLQDYEFGSLTSAKRRNGEIVFGGINGINVFRPDQIFIDTIKPKVLISGFAVFNKNVKVGEEFGNRILIKKSLAESPTIQLKHNENYFEIWFEALHYVNPGKNQYKYRLRGFETDWIVTSALNRSAKYTNMPPGHYFFEVLASNSDGVWTDKAASIEIIVTKPWWLTIYAIFAYLVALVFFIIIFSKYTIISYRKKVELDIAEIEKNKIKELSELQANFFTNISHEFRTPLSLIVAPVKQLLLMDTTSGEKKKLYNLISHNANILQRLINQLLDLAKYEKGKLKLVRTSADIIDFSNKTLYSFEELALQKQISLRFKTSFKYLLFSLDYNMYEHVLYNLLSNALKNTPVGGTINLTITKNSETLIITVTDNGKGIPPEFQSTIFERFSQVNPYESGTGLGLSYSKILVEINGGTISMVSKVDIGTSFTIEFPIRDMPLYVENNEQQPQNQVETEIVHTAKECDESTTAKNDVPTQSKPSLLIVDDDFSILQYLSDYFSPHYEVLLGQNGMEGLSIAQTAEVDIIVSDVMMPEMDGKEFTKRIKTEQQTSHIPVILLTAKNTNEDLIGGYEAGADLYCPKPFDLNVLEAMIGSLVHNRELLKKEFQSSPYTDSAKLSVNNIDREFLSKSIDIVIEHIADEGFSVTQLASDMSTTPYLLNKKLKALTGSSANNFIRTIRLKEAAKLLIESSLTISEINYKTGFNDPKYFRECFMKMFGVNPITYRKQNKKES
jgi:signal transduction histidine kinase/DNA-binding response OmpR family regulator/ligand-binding sensor domain-containing protein